MAQTAAIPSVITEEQKLFLKKRAEIIAEGRVEIGCISKEYSREIYAREYKAIIEKFEAKIEKLRLQTAEDFQNRARGISAPAPRL